MFLISPRKIQTTSTYYKTKLLFGLETTLREAQPSCCFQIRRIRTSLAANLWTHPYTKSGIRKNVTFFNASFADDCFLDVYYTFTVSGIAKILPHENNTIYCRILVWRKKRNQIYTGGPLNTYSDCTSLENITLSVRNKNAGHLKRTTVYLLKRCINHHQQNALRHSTTNSIPSPQTSSVWELR